MGLIEEDSFAELNILICTVYFRAVSTWDVFSTSKKSIHTYDHPHQSVIPKRDQTGGRSQADTHVLSLAS